MKVVTKLKRDIERQKKSLIKKVEKKGIYENFGQKEIDKLQDKYIDASKYTDDMNEARRLIQEFNEWCMSYNGGEV
jgi:hypothetical protein